MFTSFCCRSWYNREGWACCLSTRQPATHYSMICVSYKLIKHSFHSLKNIFCITSILSPGSMETWLGLLQNWLMVDYSLRLLSTEFPSILMYDQPGISTSYCCFIFDPTVGLWWWWWCPFWFGRIWRNLLVMALFGLCFQLGLRNHHLLGTTEIIKVRESYTKSPFIFPYREELCAQQ